MNGRTCETAAACAAIPRINSINRAKVSSFVAARIKVFGAVVVVVAFVSSPFLPFGAAVFVLAFSSRRLANLLNVLGIVDGSRTNAFLAPDHTADLFFFRAAGRRCARSAEFVYCLLQGVPRA